MTRRKRADPVDPTTTKQILAAYRRLIAAIIKAAMQDAKRGDLEAQDWLRTDGVFWLDWLGIRQPKAGVERLLDPPGKMVIRVGGNNG